MADSADYFGCPVGTYDMDGTAIDVDLWKRLYNDGNFKLLARSRIGRFVVDTQWLGYDQAQAYPDYFRNHPPGAPLIFSTSMLDENGEGSHDYWCTREEALRGHDKIVERAKAAA